jgi:hypothetical protein
MKKTSIKIIRFLSLVLVLLAGGLFAGRPAPVQAANGVGQQSISLTVANAVNGVISAPASTTCTNPPLVSITGDGKTPVSLLEPSYWPNLIQRLTATTLLVTDQHGCNDPVQLINVPYVYFYGATSGPALDLSKVTGTCGNAAGPACSTLIGATAPVVPAPKPVAGACGLSNGAALTAAPASGLCTTGAASSISGVGPWLWSCAGSGGGATASCAATAAVTSKGPQPVSLTALNAVNGIIPVPASTTCTNAPLVTVNGDGKTPVSLLEPSYWPNLIQRLNATTVMVTDQHGCNDPVKLINVPYVYFYGATSGPVLDLSKVTGTCGDAVDPACSTLITATAPVSSISGACGASNGMSLASAPNSSLCTTGSASAVTGSGPFAWSCTGSNGGSTAACTAQLQPPKVIGACGASNNMSLASLPTSALCTTGEASKVSGTGPWTWNCAGSNGGTTQACTANIVVNAVNGLCSVINGGTTASSPSGVLCGSGIPSVITANSTSFTWNCAGTGGGTSENCYSNLQGATINGECGPQNNSGTSDYATLPIGLCSAGTSTFPTGYGPWAWTCTGANGGKTANCSTGSLSAQNGACGPANGMGFAAAPTANLCATGGASAVTGTGIFNWSCGGSNGGTTAVCTANLTSGPLNGACGLANNASYPSAPTTSLCATGAASSVSGSGPFNWSCAGSNGGSNTSCMAFLGTKNPGQCTGSSTPPEAANVTAPVVPQPQMASDIVGIIVQNTGSTDLGTRPITFGQVFKIGQVHVGDNLVAHIYGTASQLQFDPLSLWSDGSVKIAALTLVNDVCANSQVPVLISEKTAADPSFSTTPVNPGTANINLQAILTFTGGAYTGTQQFDLGAALKKTLAAPDYWLSGPLVTQTRASIVLPGGSLRLVADVSAFADGSVKADVQFNNDIAMQGVGGLIAYNATITLNGVTQTQSNLTQYQYQTWHAVLQSNGVPQVNVQHDILYMEHTGAIQAYDTTNPIPQSDLTYFATAMAQGPADGWGPLCPGNGTTYPGVVAGVTKFMGETGDRNEIGDMTYSQSVWAMTQDPIAAQYALAEADYAAGAVPWHFYDPTRNSYVKVTDYTNLWADYRCAYNGGTCLTPLPDFVSPQASGWSPDTAHVGAFSYFPYLMTATRYYLDQLNAQATEELIITAPPERQNPDGTEGGVMVSVNNQTRANAWGFRDIVYAKFANPESGSSSMKAYFTSIEQNNTKYLQSLITGNGILTTEGQASGYLPEYPLQVPTWQYDYELSSLVMAAKDEDLAMAQVVLPWTINFATGRFLNAANGFNPYNGIVYYLQVSKDGGKSFIQTWAELQAYNDTIVNPGNTSYMMTSDTANQWTPSLGPDTVMDACAALSGIHDVTGDPGTLAAYNWILTASNPLDCSRASLATDPRRDIIPLK